MGKSIQASSTLLAFSHTICIICYRINGIIRAVLITIITTLSVTFLVNFLSSWPTIIDNINKLIYSPDILQARDILSYIFTMIKEIFSLSNPFSLIIGSVIGTLLGISTAISTVF